MKKKKTRPNRPGWDEYFLEMAKLVSKRATCLRRRVGAVLVKDKKILATGYNGAPSGLKHCLDIGCLREKLNIPSGERHELCLPPDEDVVTDEGYLPISKVKLGQRVLTHKGLYRKVIKIFKREYNGKMCCIEPYNLLPVALTPEHPVLAIKTQLCQSDHRTLCKEICKSVNNIYCHKPYLNYKTEWIPAGKLRERDLVVLPFDCRGHHLKEIDLSSLADASQIYYKVLEERMNGKTYNQIYNKLGVYGSTAYNWVKGGAPRNCIVLHKDTLKHGSSLAKLIPREIQLNDRILRLIGLYLAEGCSSSNQISFSFHRKESGLIGEVKTTMRSAFGLDCYEYKCRNSHVLVYSSIILAKAFKILFGENAYTKKLPQFLLRMPPEKQKYIISAYREGDGWMINQHTATVTTVSKYLALQVVQILLRLGYIPMIDSARNAFRIIWKESYKFSYGYLKENNFLTPLRKIDYREYSGYVYNLEVEGDNSYVTKSFVVHNCRGLHAEQNALIQASLYGISAKDSTLYATNQPCIICAKMLINAGIKEVVVGDGYPDKMAMDFLKEAKIKVRKVK